MRSTTAPETSATVMMQNVAWKAMNSRCGIVVPSRGSNVTSCRNAWSRPADRDAVALVEGERVAHERPHDGRDGERGDAHHERVERVLRAHEPGVEEPERRRHQQHERGRGEHPRGVARVDLALSASRRPDHAPTGVTAPWSVSPVRMRTARSSGTTKILPSPTSPVRAPSQSASIVGSTNVVGDGDLEAHLLGQPHLHGRAAVGLDAVELAAVSLDAADRDPADLGAVQRLQTSFAFSGRTIPITSFKASRLPSPKSARE